MHIFEDGHAYLPFSFVICLEKNQEYYIVPAAES